MGVTREVHKIAYAKHPLRRQMSAHWEEFSWFRRKGRAGEDLKLRQSCRGENAHGTVGE